MPLQKIEWLKRKAKRLKKGTNLSYLQSLDAIAKNVGFVDWPRLMLAGDGHEVITLNELKTTEELIETLNQ